MPSNLQVFRYSGGFGDEYVFFFENQASLEGYRAHVGYVYIYIYTHIFEVYVFKLLCKGCIAT